MQYMYYLLHYIFLNILCFLFVIYVSILHSFYSRRRLIEFHIESIHSIVQLRIVALSSIIIFCNLHQQMHF